EKSGNALDSLRDRMQATHMLTATRQRHIDGFDREPNVYRGRVERLATHADFALQHILNLVNLGTRSRTLLGRQLTQPLELLGEAAFLPQIPHAQFFECGDILGCRDSFAGSCGELFQTVHQDPRYRSEHLIKWLGFGFLTRKAYGPDT